MNEKIDHFTFYKNYYDIIKYLNDEQKVLIVNAILEFMFEDKEPKLEGLLLGIWNNIKMPLNTTKNKVIKGKKGGAPKGNNNAKKTTKKQPKNNLKTTKKQANNISVSVSSFLFLFSNLSINNNRKDIEDLFKEYLELRIKQKYVLSETVVTRLINKLNEYGKTDKAKKEIIQNAINGAWKDFYPLKENELPEWWGEDYKEEPIENSEIKELIGKYE